MILLDANILVRLANKYDPSYSRTASSIVALRTHAIEPLLCAQTLYEFWAVATRQPVDNGLGFDLPHAYTWTSHFTSIFRLLAEPPDIYTTWIRLVNDYKIKGFRAHDVRYVALMQLNGIADFLTYNTKHFSSFPINIIDPTIHPSTF